MDRGPPQKRNDPAKIPFAGPRKTEFLPPGAPRAREVFCSGAALSGGWALGGPAKGTGRPQGVPAKPEPTAEGRRARLRRAALRAPSPCTGFPAPTLPAQQTARVFRPVRFLEGEIMKMRGCRFYLARAAFLASFLASSRLTMTAQAASPTMLMVVRPISNRRSMP